MRSIAVGITGLAAGVWLAVAGVAAQSLVKMTIATGVDPAFSQFYVAKEAGLFEKNGLDVTINTGPSGSAMVPFLINNQVQAAYGSDLAGVINHNIDNNVVAVADGTYLVKWLSVVGRNVDSLDGLKGKKIGIAKGTGSEIFWNRVIEKKKLKSADYTIVDVEAPEMLAAIERGDIDGFATWEPWPTRTLMAVKGTKIVQDAEGIYNNINFVYMNRGWIEQNQATAEKFIRALIEANDLIGNDRPAAAKMVAKFLKMPLELATELMPKVEFDMTWTDRAVATIKVAEEQLTKQKKLKAPLDYTKYVYSDLIKKVRPENVMITALPTK
jgi:ABC-type nitrate/sulfonate/bicarbonate transport system substrate-binding protein